MNAYIITGPIFLTVTASVPVTIAHGLGREPAGWLVIWSDVDVQFHVEDADADARQELVLVPSATANVRLVLLS